MRQQGTIVRWDDAKGFGFIREQGVDQQVFVHVRDFRRAAGELPRTGLAVTFERIHVGGKGPRAMAVAPVSAQVAPHARRDSGQALRAPGPRRPLRVAQPVPGSGARWMLPLMAAYALGLAWLSWHRQVPVWLLPASMLLNLATFFAYWLDKHAAGRGAWRTPEQTLHLWSLAGGWGGAWFAQQLLRHKSAKASFRSVYAATVVAHCAAVAGACWFWVAR